MLPCGRINESLPKHGSGGGRKWESDTLRRVVPIEGLLTLGMVEDGTDGIPDVSRCLDRVAGLDFHLHQRLYVVTRHVP